MAVGAPAKLFDDNATGLAGYTGWNIAQTGRSQYAQIGSENRAGNLYNDIWMAALWYVEYPFVMNRLVTTFNDLMGMQARKLTQYQEEGVNDNLGENQDLLPTPFERKYLREISPKEIGKQHLISYRRVETDTENVIADSGREIGYTMGKKVEQDLLNTFQDFETSVGSYSDALTMEMIFSARAFLQNTGIPGPYYTVISPYQYFSLWQQATNIQQPADFEYRSNMMRQYMITNIADVDIIVSSLLRDDSSGVKEVQVINLQSTDNSNSTGGTVTVSYGGRTASLAYNVTSSAAKTALQAIVNDTINTVAVSSGESITVTFSTSGRKPLFIVEANNLTATGKTFTADGAVTRSTVGRSRSFGGLFTRDAVVFDLRRGLLLEPDRNPSARNLEFNASMIYAADVWRPERGVQLISGGDNPNI